MLAVGISLAGCPAYLVRRPPDVGAPFRALDASWIVSLELLDSRPPMAHSYATSDPSIVGPCLAAVRRASQATDATFSKPSLLRFNLREPGHPPRVAPLRLNSATVARDLGADVAACVEDVRRRAKMKH